LSEEAPPEIWEAVVGDRLQLAERSAIESQLPSRLDIDDCFPSQDQRLDQCKAT
jgi:hypothetical protein